LQCVAVCCSVLQCVVVCCNVLQCIAVCCSVLQCVAVCCSVLQRVAVCCGVLQCAAVSCSVLQCVAVCCSGTWPIQSIFICHTCLLHTCIHTTSTFVYGAWLIQSKFAWVTWLSHTCTHVTSRFTRGIWLIQSKFACSKWPFLSGIAYGTWIIDKCALVTGWRRPIWCLKLQVIFHKRATNYRALLQKMTYKDKASYGSLPSCTSISTRGIWLIPSWFTRDTLFIRVPISRVHLCVAHDSFKIHLCIAHDSLLYVCTHDE